MRALFTFVVSSLIVQRVLWRSQTTDMSSGFETSNGPLPATAEARSAVQWLSMSIGDICKDTGCCQFSCSQPYCGACCCACRYGEAADMVGMDSYSKWCCLLGWGFCLTGIGSLAGFCWIPPMEFHARLRERAGMPRETCAQSCDSCCVHMWCPCCKAYQNFNAAKAIAAEMAPGSGTRSARYTQMETMRR